MPVYAYRCSACGEMRDAYRKVDERHDAPACECGVDMQLRIMPAAVHPDIAEYASPITGLPVCGRKQREEDLKRHDCRPYEGREQEEREAARHRAYHEARAGAEIEDTLHRVFNSMAPEKRRRLEGK